MRLTETLRSKIRNRMIEHRFTAEQKALDEAFTKLSDDVYRDVFSDTDRRKMQRLPEGWLPERDELAVKFGTAFTHIKFDSARRVPDSMDSFSRAAKVYPASHALTQRYDQLSKRRSDLDTAMVEARRQIWGALNSVTTLKRLHEVWPESKQFTADLDPRPTLPAVPVKTLNKMLNLAA